MPELAEVEFFRKRWSPAIGHTIRRVHLHEGKRVFRECPPGLLEKALTGSRIEESWRRAKSMLFRFSSGSLGLRLGMTGALSLEPPDFTPGKHDHLVLYLDTCALVFTDPRTFGGVRFTPGLELPAWWQAMPPELSDHSFNRKRLEAILDRHPGLTLKALLLRQESFPGIGNWMADEILWQAGLAPGLRPPQLDVAARGALLKSVKHIVRISLQTIGNGEGRTFGDPPEGWLFHERWTARGHCPKHGLPLTTATLGGRTTRWCAVCQK